MPENPRITDYLIRVSDAPRWLNKFLRRFSGKGIIKCHYNDAGIPAEFLEKEVREVFFDVSPFYKNSAELEKVPYFAKRWQKTLDQAIPASLCRIIYLDDEASMNLAQLVRNHIFGEEKALKEPENFQFESSEKFKKFDQLDVRDDGATVVVCGCMCTGRKLMSVSQSLRKIQRNGAIIFLVGLSRTPDKADYKEIADNLTFGDVASDYAFQCIESVHCHDNPSLSHTSWQDEIVYLGNLKHFALQQNPVQHEIVEIIKSRLDVLNSVAISRGLSSNAFWESPKGERLALRPNMAFVDFDYDENRFSQSEVYFTVSSILHKLRDPNQKDAHLVQREHHRVVLKPQCFYRFNDGIIQSALLRAADRVELDYSVSQKHSQLMKDVLTYVFDNWDNEAGEATTEFLIALGTEKLKLRKEELLPLVNILMAKHNITPLLKFLCEQIITQ